MPVMEPAIESFVSDAEAWLRPASFVAIFVLMSVWEIIAPKRELSVSKSARWTSNLGLLVINSLMLRLFFPAAAVGLAAAAQSNHWGLFNQLALPYWLELALALLALDLAIYLQHLAMHKVPLLWRLHRVHHADLDIDLTTGTRFHSIEILLSMLFKWLLVVALGPALLAVLVFEIVLSGMAVFNHANVALPFSVDRMLRRVLVTPDMHRVHHSILRRETDSNYGFNLSLWDRWFGTYREQPEKGHQAMTIGIAEFRDASQVDRLPGMLALPFVRRP